jgi:hypothetical protein
MTMTKRRTTRRMSVQRARKILVDAGFPVNEVEYYVRKAERRDRTSTRRTSRSSRSSRSAPFADRKHSFLITAL